MSKYNSEQVISMGDIKENSNIFRVTSIAVKYYCYTYVILRKKNNHVQDSEEVRKTQRQGEMQECGGKRGERRNEEGRMEAKSDQKQEQKREEE